MPTFWMKSISNTEGLLIIDHPEEVTDWKVAIFRAECLSPLLETG
jgi:hypothetical protein